MKEKGQRISMLTEILNGIKVTKPVVLTFRHNELVSADNPPLPQIELTSLSIADNKIVCLGERLREESRRGSAERSRLHKTVLGISGRPHDDMVQRSVLGEWCRLQNTL